MFDDNTGTKWEAADHETPWIAYEFPDDETHVVTTYSVTSAADTVADDPKTWELQGSEDGPDVAEEDLNWVTLDSRTGQEFEQRYETRFYEFDNDTAYHRYRFLVTEAGDDPSFQISELELFEEGTPVFSVDDAVFGRGEHQFEYSGGWTGHTFDHMTTRYNGSSSWSNLPGESFSFTFVGSRIRLFGIVDPKHGIGAVTVNGNAAGAADFYGPSTGYNRLVYESPWLCPGEHTVTVTVSGDKHPSATDLFSSVDRIQVIP